VSIESKKDAKGAHTELLVGSSAELMPDTNAVLILKSSGNELFSRKHGLTLTNGMLATLSAEDEGKAGEILVDAASIAFNLMTFGAGGGFGGMADLVASSPGPDASEIQEALNSIALGPNVYVLSLSDDGDRFLPGTSDLLAFRAVTKIDAAAEPNKAVRHAIQTVKNAQTTAELSKALESEFASFDGILTKLWEPQSVTVEIRMNLRALYTKRLASGAKQKKDLNKALADATTEVTTLTAQLADPNRDTTKDAMRNEARKEAQKVEAAAQKAVNNDIPKIDAAIVANTAFLGALPGAGAVFVPISTRTSIIQIPDFSPVVKIPMKRAPLGKSTYNLSLDRGVLASMTMDRPSAGLEIIKIPLRISEALVKLPTQLIQIKIDYSTKVKELVAKQTEIEAARKALQTELAGVSDYDKAKQLLVQEKEILTLQKDIADLKAKIEELEK
jgi:hypothetical protein